jgi:hypothetical protein
MPSAVQAIGALVELLRRQRGLLRQRAALRGAGARRRDGARGLRNRRFDVGDLPGQPRRVELQLDELAVPAAAREDGAVVERRRAEARGHRGRVAAATTAAATAARGKINVIVRRNLAVRLFNVN